MATLTDPNEVLTGLESQLQGRSALAFKALKAAALPSRQQESWKYAATDFLNSAWLLPPAPLLAESPKIDSLPRLPTGMKAEELGAELVFYNGYLIKNLSFLPEGIELAYDVWAADEEWLNLLNAATAPETLSLRIRKSFNKPILMSFLTQGQTDPNRPLLSSARVSIRIDAQVDVTLVERHIGFSELEYHSCTSLRTDLGEGANVHWVRIQCENHNSRYFSTIESKVASTARLGVHQYAFGGQSGRSEAFIHLAGRNAEADIKDCSLATLNQMQESRWTLRHLAEESKSTQALKAAAGSGGKIVLNGKILIEKTAQLSDAQQICKSLLLGANAEVDAKPELEIYADNVKAKHGASVGSLDPEQLFYLQTRSIDRKQAVRMMLKAFVDETSMDIENPAAASIVLADTQKAVIRLQGSLL